MRFDKLTTKFQQALADAQSLALGNDNGAIEPQHLLSTLLDQEDGGTSALLSRAGVAVPKLKQALKKAIERLPKVEGQGGEIAVSRDLNNLLNLTDKEANKRGDLFIASELFLLAVADDKGETGRLLKESGLTRKELETAIGMPSSDLDREGYSTRVAETGLSTTRGADSEPRRRNRTVLEQRPVESALRRARRERARAEPLDLIRPHEVRQVL